MRNMLYIIWGSLCLLLVISGCKSTDGAKAPVSLTWKMGAVEVQPGYYENSFVLKNISDVPLGKDWIIYYSQLPSSKSMTRGLSPRQSIYNRK